MALTRFQAQAHIARHRSDEGIGAVLALAVALVMLMAPVVVWGWR